MQMQMRAKWTRLKNSLINDLIRIDFSAWWTSDLKILTDQCDFISNLCTWRSMTTSVCWVDEMSCLLSVPRYMLYKCAHHFGSRDCASYIECTNKWISIQYSSTMIIDKNVDKDWYIKINLNRFINSWCKFNDYVRTWLIFF